MSAATSPGTGLAYGLQRVCAAWGFARSSFYAMKSRQQATAERPPAKRRGPNDEACWWSRTSPKPRTMPTPLVASVSHNGCPLRREQRRISRPRLPRFGNLHSM